jgi:hypothetical protein
MKTVTMSTTVCPGCRAVINRATSEAGVTPEPGDITVCAYCARILAFTPALTLRLATAADLENLTPAARQLLTRYHLALGSGARSN